MNPMFLKLTVLPLLLDLNQWHSGISFVWLRMMRRETEREDEDEKHTERKISFSNKRNRTVERVAVQLSSDAAGILSSLSSLLLFEQVAEKSRRKTDWVYRSRILFSTRFGVHGCFLSCVYVSVDASSPRLRYLTRTEIKSKTTVTVLPAESINMEQETPDMSKNSSIETTAPCDSDCHRQR